MHLTIKSNYFTLINHFILKRLAPKKFEMNKNKHFRNRIYITYL